ncbi:MAG: hypothetical protein ACKPKO_51800, partial [Candidatus Fonsibacter sp.]
MCTDDTFHMTQLQNVHICQHILHAPQGNILAWYACIQHSLCHTTEGLDDAAEASAGGALVGGGGGVTSALAVHGGGVDGAGGWLALATAPADALAAPSDGVGGGGRWLAPVAAPGDATRNSNLCLPWRCVFPVYWTSTVLIRAPMDEAIFE